MGSALYCISAAYDMARASLIAPFAYSQMVWGGLLGFLIFEELPSPNLYIGGLMIIASGMFIMLRERYLIRHGILVKRQNETNISNKNVKLIP